MKFIRFNSLEKKYRLLLLYVYIGSTCFFIGRLIDGIAPFDYNFFDSICQLIVFIPIYIFKSIKKKIKKSNSNVDIKYFKNTYKDYIIFGMIIIINYINNIILLNRDKAIKVLYGFTNTNNFEIFLIKVMIKIYTKDNYYLHQMIHHIIISVLSLGIDNLKYSYNKIRFDLPHFTLFLLSIILRCVLLSYKKYLIEIKNISVYKLCSVFGILNMLFYLVIMAINHYYHNFICFNSTCLLFFDFNMNSTKIIISGILCIINIYFFYLIIYNFTAFFIPILFIVNNFAELLVFLITSKKILHIIIYVVLTILILISFSVFLEIIEINLCGMNTNLKRNIIQREEDDEKVYIDDDEKKEDDEKKKGIQMIEISTGYLVDFDQDGNNENDNDNDNSNINGVH